MSAEDRVTRLLLYSDRNGVFGAEQIDHRLILACDQAGFEVGVAQPPGETVLTAERKSVGIPHYALPEENVYDWRHPAPSLTDPTAAERCLGEARPDLILFADSFPLANLAAKEAARRRGIPYLVLVHCVQPAWAEQYRAFVARLPAVYTAAGEVVAVSSDNLDGLRRYFGLPTTRGRVIVNGRPRSFFAPPDAAVRRRVRAELGIPDDSVVALTIGRYEMVKGYDLLLDAMPIMRRSAQWDRLAFVWVGSGTLEERFRRLARLVGGDRIRVLGERSDVAALLDAADLLIHPARFEGMPLVVLEAMAKRLAVVASGIGGNVEALADTGVILSASVDTIAFRTQLAAAVCALTEDAERRRQLGTAAHARALTHFSEVRMTADHLDLIRSVLAPS